MSIPALLALILTAATLGGMLYFVGGVAPVLFRVLKGPEAGRLLRALFPIYYILFGTASLLAAFLAGAAGRKREAALLGLVAAGFMVARQGLMPRINALRDRTLAGEAAAEPGFNALHRASVILNLVQMVGLIAAAILLGR